MVSRRRIVIDARYMGPTPSGIGNYVRALISRLPSLAPDLQFRVWVGRIADARSMTSNQIQIHQVSASPNGAISVAAPWLLDRLTPHDVFHATSNILGSGLPRRSIVTIHDVMWINELEICQPDAWRRPISRAYFGNGIRRALQKARKIITVSHTSACSIRSIEPSAEHKIVVTHNACESCFRPTTNHVQARRRVAGILGFEEDYLMVVGQNQPSKGHSVALRAFAAANVPNIFLIYVQRLRTGCGLFRLAHGLGVAGRVRIIGDCSQEDLILMMQCATALLQPSLSEGFGLPVLEAAACGCPVVASNLSVFHEVLQDAALFAPVGDIAAWSRAIQRIAADVQLRRQLKLTGLTQALRFSWDRTAAETLQVYRKVLEEV